MNAASEQATIRLGAPPGWSTSQRDRFLTWVQEAPTSTDGLVEAPTSLRSLSAKAAYSVMADLINQGWDLSCEGTEILVRPPIVNGDPHAEANAFAGKSCSTVMNTYAANPSAGSSNEWRPRGGGTTSACPSSASCATATTWRHRCATCAFTRASRVRTSARRSTRTCRSSRPGSGVHTQGCVLRTSGGRFRS